MGWLSIVSHECSTGLGPGEFGAQLKALGSLCLKPFLNISGAVGILLLGSGNAIRGCTTSATVFRWVVHAIESYRIFQSTVEHALLLIKQN